MSSIADVLERYTIKEILQLNDMTEEDVLEFLVDIGFKLPKVIPLDFD
jgi:hypothetical protein